MYLIFVFVFPPHFDRTLTKWCGYKTLWLGPRALMLCIIMKILDDIMPVWRYYVLTQLGLQVSTYVLECWIKYDQYKSRYSAYRKTTAYRQRTFQQRLAKREANKKDAKRPQYQSEVMDFSIDLDNVISNNVKYNNINNNTGVNISSPMDIEKGDISQPDDLEYILDWQEKMKADLYGVFSQDSNDDEILNVMASLHKIINV